MRPIKFLHCADVHIGAQETCLGLLTQQRRAEALITFEKIIELAKQRSVDLLLISGDLFHSNNIEPEFVSRVAAALSSLDGIPVVIAAGNHDPLVSNSPYLSEKMPNNVHIFGGDFGCKVFEDIGVRVYGRSFTGTYMKSCAFPTPKDGNYCNIAVIHGDISGDSNSNYNGISSTEIENSGMDYIALGHIHKRTELLKSGKTHYAYSGCPEGQGFDELGEKGVYIGTLDNGQCSLEFVPVCHRQHLAVTVDVSDCSDTTEIIVSILHILKQIPDFNKHFYKIILTGGISENTKIGFDEISAQLQMAVYYAKIKDQTHIKADLAALAGENGLKGVFVRRMLELDQAAQTQEEKEKIKRALDIGLRAFYSEVKYRENQ